MKNINVFFAKFLDLFIYKCIDFKIFIAILQNKFDRTAIEFSKELIYIKRFIFKE